MRLSAFPPSSKIWSHWPSVWNLPQVHKIILFEEEEILSEIKVEWGESSKIEITFTVGERNDFS